MFEIMYSIFGSYSPVIDPVTGNIVSGWSGLDIPYICGVLLFAVVLHGVFRLVGVLLKEI